MTTAASDPAKKLKDFKPKHKHFVGIDSDGCAFDTMEIKQKECFIPNIIKHWQLQAISKYTREAAEFVNLYSEWRGINRWPALLMVFDLLRERPEVQRRRVQIPDVASLRAFAKSGKPLSNQSLKEEVQRTGDPILTKALAWSEAVNAAIEDMVKGVPPFPFMRESLEKLNDHVDAVVVSQTPTEALVREWQEHDIDRYVEIIAGQEMGTKSEHIKFASEGRYERDRVLMIGDALGDYKAARDNHACFFPVNPGGEEESWQRFHDEGIDKFLNGKFAGEYEQSLFADFKKHLPSTPPWKRTH